VVLLERPGSGRRVHGSDRGWHVQKTTGYSIIPIPAKPDVSRYNPWNCLRLENVLIVSLFQLIHYLPSGTKCTSFHFANDTILLHSHNNAIHLELKVNLELDKIQNWMNANKLTVNFTKSN